MSNNRRAAVTETVRADTTARLPRGLPGVGHDLQPLRFGASNAKLPQGVHTFSIPAGWTCRFAKNCLSKADRKTGCITDGNNTEFRCYATTMEARHTSVRLSRWHNLEQLKKCRNKGEMARLISDSLSPFIRVLRVHDSGDFFSQDYLDAWLEVARQRVSTLFYSYLKALPLWVRRLDEVGTGREPGRLTNVVFTASWGGTHDYLIERYGLRSARVVFGEDEAAKMGLVIDHDDTLAMAHGDDFALLIHGTQPKGGAAAEAVRALRDRGWTGYGERSRIPLAARTR